MVRKKRSKLYYRKKRKQKGGFFGRLLTNMAFGAAKGVGRIRDPKNYKKNERELDKVHRAGKRKLGLR